MALQPNAQLELDAPQEQGFISFYNGMPEKPPTTIRFFDRSEFYTLHGQDAIFAAKEVYKTTSVVKILGGGNRKLESVVLNRSVFESFARELLIVKQYRIEIYVPKTAGRNCSDWILQYQASPGNLLQVEELIFTNADITTSTGVLAVKITREGSSLTVGCCYVDTNERKILVSQFNDSDSYSNLESLLVQLGPKESILPLGEEYSAVKQVLQRSGLLVSERKKADFSCTDITRDLNKLLKFKKGQQENAAALPQADLIQSMAALAALIKYLNLTSDESNANQFSISTFDLTQYVRLDSAAVRALHLIPAGGPEGGDARISGTAPRSLLALLNKCRTAGGQRLLSQWIKQPLMDIQKINERLDVVEAFVDDVQLRQTVAEDHLRRIPDMQRLSKKLQRKRATLQDCFRLYQAIKRLAPLCTTLQQYEGPHATVLATVFLEPLHRSAEQLSKFAEMVESTVDMQLAEQGDFVIRADFVEGLGELRSQMDELESQMQNQLNKAARDLNLEPQKTVKLESNSQLGYFFRVTLKDEKALRNNRNYRTIDTNKNGVRFRNSALQDLNEQYLVARQQYESEQQAVVQEVLGVAAGYSEPIYHASETLSELDVLLSFAACAVSAPIPYVRPKMEDKDCECIELRQLRHPCLELQDGVNYIPNDAVFQKDGKRFYVITGPNMGGKSTYIRSVGVAVVMAHIGCFVPAESARISIVDSVLARVGAGDCQLKGVSTFMAEMIETANIIRTATKNSLVIIDELGRGTSTYDGFGLAWAIAENIARDIGSYALFATHFHELTSLEDSVPTAANVHVSALTGNNTLTLLYRVQPGSCDQSFGIHVAELVNFPQSALERARKKAAELEGQQPSRNALRIDQDTEEVAAKRRKQDKQESLDLIKGFVKRAKEISNSGLDEGQVKLKLDALRQEAKCCGNSFVLSLLAD